MRAVQATKTPAMQGFLSPLPDSNRGRLLTMEDSRCGRGTEKQRLLWRFSCNYAVSSARRTPPSKSPESP